MPSLGAATDTPKGESTPSTTAASAASSSGTMKVCRCRRLASKAIDRTPLRVKTSSRYGSDDASVWRPLIAGTMIDQDATMPPLGRYADHGRGPFPASRQRVYFLD